MFTFIICTKVQRTKKKNVCLGHLIKDVLLQLCHVKRVQIVDLIVFDTLKFGKFRNHILRL